MSLPFLIYNNDKNNSDENHRMGDSSQHDQNDDDNGSTMQPLHNNNSTLAGASGMADQVRHDGEERNIPIRQTLLLPFLTPLCKFVAY
jgi:hypothetical protein